MMMKDAEGNWDTMLKPPVLRTDLFLWLPISRSRPSLGTVTELLSSPLHRTISNIFYDARSESAGAILGHITLRKRSDAAEEN